MPSNGPGGGAAAGAAGANGVAGGAVAAGASGAAAAAGGGAAGAVAGGGAAGGAAEGAADAAGALDGAVAGAEDGAGVACASATPSTSNALGRPKIHPKRIRIDIDRFIFRLLIGSRMDKELPARRRPVGRHPPITIVVNWSSLPAARSERLTAETQTAVSAQLCNAPECRQRTNKKGVNRLVVKINNK
jgi:hypothetical protein